MRSARVTLLLAAALLVAAEFVSLSVLLKGIAERQSQRTSVALDRAALLMPRIAEWALSVTGSPAEVVNEPWTYPFDRLALEDSRALALDEPTRLRLDSGEPVVASRIADRSVSILGSVSTARGPVVFRLTEESMDASRIAADQTQIAQHGLILLAALAGLVLAALGRGAAPLEVGSPALRAYEEAMTQLRVRGDERVAAFDREKDQLTSTLRDREAMARAGELTAGIVHEVRNSMGTIATHARLAEKSGDERVQAAAAAIGDEVRTLQSAMLSFLEFIRTERIQDVEFDLSKLVARVTAREQSNHATNVEVQGTRTLIRGDEDLLERAIENVVRNACQAAGSEGRVKVTFGADAASAFVMVEDNGPGIADIEKALRPFESSRPGGLGLGLPLVLKILTRHQGTLDLGPGPGGAGTRAVCRWPLSPAP